jgi:hypothetical protein
MLLLLSLDGLQSAELFLGIHDLPQVLHRLVDRRIAYEQIAPQFELICSRDLGPIAREPLTSKASMRPLMDAQVRRPGTLDVLKNVPDLFIAETITIRQKMTSLCVRRDVGDPEFRNHQEELLVWVVPYAAACVQWRRLQRTAILASLGT